MSRTVIVSDKLPPLTRPYSYSVKAGGWVFTAGLLGVDATGRVVGNTPGAPDADAQTRQALDHLATVLTTLETSVDRVAKAKAYLTDFRLFDEPSTAFGRVRKNLESVRALSESDDSIRGRVANLGLVNRGLRRRLAEFLVEHGVEDPAAWARQIALDRKNWDISFDKWEFASQIAPDRVDRSGRNRLVSPRN